MQPGRAGRVGHFLDGALVQHGVDGQQGIAFELGRRGQVQVADHHAGGGVALQHAGLACHRQIGRQHQVGGADGDTHDVQRGLIRGDLHMRHHGAVLLGEAGEVQRLHRAAFQMRRHGQDRARGHDSAASDPGEQPAPHGGMRHHRVRQRRCEHLFPILPARIGNRRRGRAGQGHEAGAEAFQAGQIDVAARRIDAAFAAERGFDWLDGDAAGLGGAVAAVLTDGLVDHDMARRLRHGATLAAAALLGGADLVVDQHGGAVVVAQFPLHRVQLFPQMHGHALRQSRQGRQPVGIVDDDGNALDALGRDLGGEHRDRRPAFRWLPAGHGDGVVEQQLVGHAGL